MQTLILKFYDLRIDYYSKRWKKIMNAMEKGVYHCTGKQFRKLMRRNTIYGGKCLDLMNKRKRLLEDLA